MMMLKVFDGADMREQIMNQLTDNPLLAKDLHTACKLRFQRELGVPLAEVNHVLQSTGRGRGGGVPTTPLPSAVHAPCDKGGETAPPTQERSEPVATGGGQSPEPDWTDPALDVPPVTPEPDWSDPAGDQAPSTPDLTLPRVDNSVSPAGDLHGSLEDEAAEEVGETVWPARVAIEVSMTDLKRICGVSAREQTKNAGDKASTAPGTGGADEQENAEEAAAEQLYSRVLQDISDEAGVTTVVVEENVPDNADSNTSKAGENYAKKLQEGKKNWQFVVQGKSHSHQARSLRVTKPKASELRGDLPPALPGGLAVEADVVQQKEKEGTDRRVHPAGAAPDKPPLKRKKYGGDRSYDDMSRNEPTEQSERGRGRERSRGNDKIERANRGTDRTQLPRVGPVISSHHNVLENQPRQESNRPPSSDPGSRRSPDLKKIKIEAKEQADTQPDSEMPEIAAAVSPAPTSAHPFLRLDHSAAFGPHEVYDLTSGDNQPDDDELNTSKLPEQPPGQATGPGNGSAEAGRPFATLTDSTPAPPPWLQDITASLKGLHMKSDQTHRYCLDLGSVVGQHDVRIQTLETATKEHTGRHDTTDTRLTALEKAISDLERRARSLTPPRGAPDTPRGSRAGNISPRSPRGGPPSDIMRDPAQDLGLVIGGWTDARVAEAEREVQNMFTEAGFEGAILDFSGPSGRTNFLRVALDYQGLGITELGKKREYQTRILNKLKSLKAKSGIVGQEDSNLWIQRDRSIEERLRIRAIVLAKNFYNAIPLQSDNMPRWPDPEIVWRGQLFVGQVRTLKNMDDGHEPAAYDQIIEDVKGNHTVWFLCAEAFAKITGRDKESLQQLWQDFGPGSSPAGARLEDVARTWDVLGFQGTHVIGLQEVGSLPQKCPTHDSVLHHEVMLAGQSYTFFFCDPSHSWRGSALGIPTSWLGQVEKTKAFCTGIGIVIRDQGTRKFLASIHMPHSLRKDHLPVWQQQTEEILHFCDKRRYHDTICLCCDLNYDVLDIVNVDERGVPLGQLLRTLGLQHTRPSSPTWRNTTGSASRIDFILFAMPSLEYRDDRVVVGSDDVLGSDHCAVSVAMNSQSSTGRASFKPSKCGKWWTDGPALQTRAEKLAETLDLQMKDLSMKDLEDLCGATSRRITSCRYKDSPAIKDMIKARKSLRGKEAQQMAKCIADKRKTDKREWLTGLLEQSAAGDFRAAAYFRKRQSTMFVQGSYCMRAGGKVKAISDLRFFYQKKYTPMEPSPSGLPMAMFHHRAGPIMDPTPFSLQEIQDVAFQCKHNKSTGADGVSYEALQMLLQSDLSHHILDMFNSVLRGLCPPPASWLTSHVCFLPKTSTPSAPSDLRPIVLSSTTAKVFTKALMLRLRPCLPRMQAFQVGGLPKRQTLDAACAVQHAIRLAEEYGKPLVIVKLDVAAAFDSLSHEAVATLLATAQGSREAELLLQIVCGSQVELGLQGTSWIQALRQGILQGSSYSAELFARCIDYFLTPTNSKWQDTEDSWLKDPSGRKLFLTPFADDLVLLATSRAQAQRLLADSEATLQAIGLRFNPKKCKYLQTPGFPEEPLHLSAGEVQYESTFLFLGILMGFQLTCLMILQARMTKVSNAFWAYYSILRRTEVGLTKRLRVFDCFITARWRWLSPAIRPLSTIHRYLRTIHTSFLTAMLRFTRDPFQGAVESWVARRRAARLAAQQVGHRAWPGEHSRQFFGYWGHAARYGTTECIPIALMLQVRGPSWYFANCDWHKRLPGKWANTSRFLQLAWEKFLARHHKSPPNSWIDGASDRDVWKAFSQDWACVHDADPSVFYKGPPEQVDLLGCQLVQNEDRFSLLPPRHVPVEEPYATSFFRIKSPLDDHLQDTGGQEHVLRVYTDGSAQQNRRGQAQAGGSSVVVLAPYGLVEEATVCYFKVPQPCTNIQAELHAAAQALQMIRRIRRQFPHVPIQLFTDSQYVVQVLEGSFLGTHHASVTNMIIHLWKELCLTVEVHHVRAHKGVMLNEVADHFAKLACTLGHLRKIFCRLNFSQAFVTDRSDVGGFLPWLA
ncbi:unnamed protein product [Symbiodinium sp. CCMP2592]|nr:unnamed protein product [Symbiodinium sp. CCMP2592]